MTCKMLPVHLVLELVRAAGKRKKQKNWDLRKAHLHPGGVPFPFYHYLSLKHTIVLVVRMLWCFSLLLFLLMRLCFRLLIATSGYWYKLAIVLPLCKLLNFLCLQCTWSCGWFWCSWPEQLQLATDFALHASTAQQTAHCPPPAGISLQFLRSLLNEKLGLKRKHQIQILEGRGWCETTHNMLQDASNVWPIKWPTVISNVLWVVLI